MSEDNERLALTPEAEADLSALLARTPERLGFPSHEADCHCHAAVALYARQHSQSEEGYWEKAYWRLVPELQRQLADALAAPPDTREGLDVERVDFDLKTLATEIAKQWTETLDVERLTNAMQRLQWGWLAWTDHAMSDPRRLQAFRNAASNIAREYAATSREASDE